MYKPPINYSSRKENEQMLAVEAAQRTLDSIDMDKYWSRVIERVAHSVQVNELIRAKSRELAFSHVVD